jgi:hypothetical protein
MPIRKRHNRGYFMNFCLARFQFGVLVLGVVTASEMAHAQNSQSKQVPENDEVSIGHFIAGAKQNTVAHIYKLTRGTVGYAGSFKTDSEEKCFKNTQFPCDHDSSSLSGKEIPLAQADTVQGKCLDNERQEIANFTKNNKNFFAKTPAVVAEPQILDNRDGKIKYEDSFLKNDFIRVEDNTDNPDAQHHLTITVFGVIDHNGVCHPRTGKELEESFLKKLSSNQNFYEHLADDRRHSNQPVKNGTVGPNGSFSQSQAPIEANKAE